MKVTKTNATLAFISVLGISFIFFDIFSAITGHKSRLWSSLKSNLFSGLEKSELVDNKIKELSDKIITLTERLSKIEESIARSEKKFIYPMTKTIKVISDFGDNNESSTDNLEFERNLSFSHHIKNDDLKLDSDRANNGFIDIQKQLKMIHGIESGFGIPDGFTFEKINDKKLAIINTMQPSLKEKKSLETSNPVKKLSNKNTKLSKDSKHNKNNPEEAKGKPNTAERNFSSLDKKDRDVIPFTISSSPNPNVISPSVSKIELPILSNGAKIIHFPNDKTLNFSEIIPDLEKNDPLVEVKRFDNYGAFKRFGDSLKNNINQKDDGSVDTKYFKMSDILVPKQNSETKSIKSAETDNKETTKPIEAIKDKNDVFEDHDVLNEIINDKNLSENNPTENEIKNTLSSMKSCDEFKDPLKAYHEGMCVLSSKEPESVIKGEDKIEKKNEDLKENEKLGDEKRQENKNESEPKPSSKNNFIKEILADKDIQIPTNEDKIKDRILNLNLAHERINQTKSDAENMIIGMIGTKFEPKNELKEDDSIPKPTVISPVI